MYYENLPPLRLKELENIYHNIYLGPVRNFSNQLALYNFLVTLFYFYLLARNSEYHLLSWDYKKLSLRFINSWNTGPTSGPVESFIDTKSTVPHN